MTGKACKTCGEWKPFAEYRKKKKKHCESMDGTCKACRTRQLREWRAQHREHYRQQSKEWRDQNKDKCLASERRYYSAHKEERCAATRNWQANNKERRRAYKQQVLAKDPDINRRQGRAWRERNPDHARLHSKEWRTLYPARAKESDRRWREKYPEKARIRVRISGQRRRARERRAEGTHSYAEWLALCEKYGNCCLCCGEQKPLTEDHVIPLARGGTDYITNIQPLCGECNSRKGTRIVDYRPLENRPEYHQEQLF